MIAGSEMHYDQFGNSIGKSNNYNTLFELSRTQSNLVIQLKPFLLKVLTPGEEGGVNFFQTCRRRESSEDNVPRFVFLS